MFRLAHLSDIHLGPLPQISYRQLASKRITGYINWRRNRAGQIHTTVLDEIVAAMMRAAPDHVAVTGDLMNLSLDDEVELARQWLLTLGDPAEVSVIPGNHDAYVPGALDKACKAWGPWMHGDGRPEPARRGTFPYMRRRGPLAIIGVSSARATAPFMASGYFGSSQSKRLGALLDEAGAAGLCRVVLIHHPPVRGATSAHKRLYGIGLFQKTLRRHGAELVLHGHTHLPTTLWIERKGDAAIPVVGVAPAGQSPGGHKPAAQFNLVSVEGEPSAWRIALERHGVTGLSSGVQRISSEVLVDLPGQPAHDG